MKSINTFFYSLALLTGCFSFSSYAWAASAASDLDLLMPAPLEASKAEVKAPDISIKPPEVADPLAQIPVPVQPPVTPEVISADPLAPSQQGKAASAQAEPAATKAEVPPSVVAPVVSQSVQPSTVDLTSLEGKIADLQKQIDAMKGGMASLEARLAAAPAKTENNAPVGKKAQPPARKQKKAALPPVRQNWILRSAKPGVAWIENEKSGELKTVAVGELAPGLGRITGISKDTQGRWVILGTQGKIRE